jgi:hypothetical protein
VGAVTESSIPKIYALPKAANVLGVSEHWLLMQIRKGRFVAMKRGRHSAMTEPQILAAIDAMTVPARESEPEVYPGGITRRSFQRRRRLIPDVGPRPHRVQSGSHLKPRGEGVLVSARRARECGPSTSRRRG